MAGWRYIPEFRVTINGEKIPSALRASITGVSYQTGLDGADRVELSLINENLRWLDHPLLSLSNQLSLAIGYADGPLAKVFTGDIVSHAAAFPSSGAPTLTVAAQDSLQRLQQGNKVRWFAIATPSGPFPMPDLEVVNLVGLENYLFPIVDPVGAALGVLLGGIEVISAQGDLQAKQRLIRKQEGESDLEFLTRIARENGWEMFIEHSGPQGGYVLRFMSPMHHLEPEVTLKYGRSLLDFTPKMSNVGQIKGVTVKVWRPEIKMDFTITVSWDWARQSLDLRITPGLDLSGWATGTPAASKSPPAKGAIPADTGIQVRRAVQGVTKELNSYIEAGITLINEPLTLASAPRKILSLLIPRLNKKLTGSGSTIGDPRLRAGTVMRLEGLGEKFGGLYRVTSATHNIDSSGYRTSFEVRKEIWFGAIPLLEQGAIPVPFQGQRLGFG